MKIILYVVAFALMIWALVEQTLAKPNLYVQIIAIIVFFFVMKDLLNKTPSNFDKDNNDTNHES
ncbi:hypothetical protein MG290_04130 [Flavobacterium sp. CBA20B-1]|uniref:Uncharacterized protein n=1 Tax=Paenimyroides aestuarii TaxID=2968490 RepID=A0ABY5NRS0_9FLAO|nr:MULTISPECIES: hypothetical protein [Flavobacteriaceae]UUV21074.1 hypothetical protein NPX36_12210 [Paenimyroides aestuarii]WCM42881.1 hypothetical protein MG290_04130 [Flavobacterium sp. CBA20B-1]